MYRSIAHLALIWLGGLCADAAAGEPQTDALDPSFGSDGDGRATVEFPHGGAFARAVNVDTEGRLVIAGAAVDAGGDLHGAIYRLRSDGTPDSAFSPTLSALPDGANQAHWLAVATTSANDILAAGGFQDLTQTSCATDDCWLVCKMDSAGHPVLDFGSGAIPGCSLIDSDGGFSGGATSMELLSDGAILLAGYQPGLLRDEATLIRVTANGSLDTSFGKGGIARLPEQFYSGSYFHGLDVGLNGEIAAAGVYGEINDRQMVVGKFTPQGKPDQDFSGGARVVAFTQLPLGKRDSVATDVHLDEEGTIVLTGLTRTENSAGQNYDRPAVVKLGADGHGVEEFGTPGLPAGQRIIDPCNVPLCHFRSVTSEIGAGGSILISGELTHSELNIRNLYAMRLSAAGEIDAGFARNDGAFSSGLGIAWWKEGNTFTGSVLQNKKLVLVGEVENDNFSAFGAVRFRDGTLFADGLESD